MQKTLIIFALLALSALGSIHINAEEVKSLWSSWKMYHGKTYSQGEEAARAAIFQENYKKVIEFNAAHEDIKFALNKFADLTSTEFKTIYASGFIKNDNVQTKPAAEFVKVGDLPASIDWRSKGAVTKVKDQGHCGSCWTFATTGALEGFYHVNHGVLLSFSEQQIVDCDTNGNQGCNGGDPAEAIDYAGQNGLELEAVYPYKAVDGTCAYKKLVSVNTNGGSQFVTPQNTDAFKTALVSQPVSISIEADEDIFHLYSSGVIKDGCGDNLDHAVLAVGYGDINGEDAFIVKNSWGTGWGQSGYVYLSTSSEYNNGNGACGILARPVVPTL